MKTTRKKAPAGNTAASWLETLPGKILAVCICILPFVTYCIPLTLPESVQNAYFLGSASTTDFEQLCREIFLVIVAAAAVICFCYERIALRPRKPFAATKPALICFLLFGVYLLLALLSSITSEYRSETWFGIYMLYEGFFALLSYGIVFLAAWYWVDRQTVLGFVKLCLTVLSAGIGILTILEHFGLEFYNNALIQLLANLGSHVESSSTAVLTFGNSDYMGMYCAMLLPVTVSMISRSDTIPRRILQIAAAVLLAVSLLLTQVMNAILFGFGVTILFLLVWTCHCHWNRVIKVSVCSVTAAAILVGCFGFLWTRSGDTVSEKFRHTMIGMEQNESFSLLSMEISGDTITLKNADTTFAVTALGEGVALTELQFLCNGAAISPLVSQTALCSFSQKGLEHCQVQLYTDRIAFQLGYPMEIQAMRSGDSWQVVGTGGVMLQQIPQVSKSETLQKYYPYLNGRVFVWADTISVLDDCWLLGHGAATSIFYLEQNDLPALLNIFGQYTLYNKPHCWYLQIAQDTGILSLVMILGILGTLAVCGCRKCFGKQSEWDPFRTGLLFSAAAYCLTAVLSDSLIYHAPMFWFLAGILLRLVTTGVKEK